MKRKLDNKQITVFAVKAKDPSVKVIEVGYNPKHLNQTNEKELRWYPIDNNKN
ncbi:MAG: hypothetical protein K0R54_3379 [Clostridiaceae bacterium]|jgi:hypothetical protein|nr:hypothetical protein [Clostridiaceae bacterium]